MLALWKGVGKGHSSNGLIRVLRKVPSSFVHAIQGCPTGKVAGLGRCAPPQEGASGLPWPCSFPLAHCLMTTW